MEPGIYLGMDEANYHADPSLSASGIKTITVSPLDYWVSLRSEREKDSTAQLLGKAYHCLILEGVEAFEQRFCVAPAKDDWPEALDGQRVLYALVKEMGIRGKSNASIGELCAAIREHDPIVQLWPEIMGEFQQERGDRHILSKDQWRALKMAEIVVGRMPSTQGMFDNGEAELSIFWDDPSGVRMKMRADKLHASGALIDLKTFANIMQKDIITAVAGEVARNRYFIQPVVYTRGLRAAKVMFQKHGEKIIHGDGNRDAVIKALSAETERFYFVFVQTGDAPNVVVREFSQREKAGAGKNIYWTRGELDVERGIELYKKCLKEFGAEEPWIADFGMEAFRDESFPLFMLSEPS